MTQQNDRQASVRAVTGTAGAYEDDWHALFTLVGIPLGTFNERLLAWINVQLGASYTEINGAMQAFAASQGAVNWSSMGTFSALDSATVALLAAMSVKPNATHTAAINNFIVGLKTDPNGLWTSIDHLSGWGALHDSQAALINWKTPAQVGTAVNSPTFAVDGGWTFDGVTNYVNTGFVPSTNAVSMSATSAMIGVYERTNVGSNSTEAGAVSTSPNRLTLKARNSTLMSGSAMSAITNSAATVADSRGLTVHNRLSGVFTFYKNGSLFDTVVPAATNGVLPTVSIFIGGENSGGALSNPGARNIAGLVLASGLNATQQAAFYTLAQACMTAIGAPA